jgi:chaperonin cofactor prefoldin
MDIQCPQTGCDMKGNKTVIRRHMINDHHLTYWQVRQILPFESQNKQVRELAQKVRNIETKVADKPAEAALADPTKHDPELSAQLSDVTQQLNKSKDYVKQLEAELSDAKATPVTKELSETDRLAVLGDWLDGMTKEAWVKIGEENGYFDQKTETDQVPVAVVGDSAVESEPAVRKVYLPSTGLLLSVKES